MKTMTATQARIPPELFIEVASNQERVRVSKFNKAVYLVSEEDLEALEALEDRYWYDEGVKALKEHEKSGARTYTLDEARKKLGI